LISTGYPVFAQQEKETTDRLQKLESDLKALITKESAERKSAFDELRRS
jgi:hypothetical protein